MSQLCSVVCVTYNHALFAEAALQSIFDQAYRDIEIIVLDDGSSDSSVEVIGRKLKDSPFPNTLITQENSGNVPRNFNLALKKARGDFVTFLSLDDLLHPEALREKAEMMSRDADLAFVASMRHDQIDRVGEVKARNVAMPMDPVGIGTAEDLLEAEFRTLGSFYIQGQLFRRDMIDVIGGFEETMIGDDIILRTKIFKHLAATPDKSFRLIDTAAFAYREHAGNLHKKTFRQIKTIVEWKERYYPGRAYPARFFGWLEYFFEVCHRDGKNEELREALEYAPVIATHYATFSSTWKFRRRSLKRRLRRLIAPSRP